MNGIELFSRLSEKIGQSSGSATYLDLSIKAYHHNGWFTKENVSLAFENLALMLNEEDLVQWMNNYKSNRKIARQKTVALIMAGNIPLAGFHDLLCVLASGHRAIVKMSSDDTVLLPFVCDMIFKIDPSFKDRIFFSERKVENFDAVIATGSNNSARYFEYYFSKYPRIIRKNRNSLAVLSGEESKEELVLLGKDIFSYFGLGCRNVSKLFVPQGYDFKLFFEAMFEYKEVLNNKKYGNNYDYQRALLLMCKIPLLDNNFMLLREDASLKSPVAVLNYEYYSQKDEVIKSIRKNNLEIQCIVSGKVSLEKAISFGATQSPGLWDYADGVDTMQFLACL